MINTGCYLAFIEQLCWSIIKFCFVQNCWPLHSTAMWSSTSNPERKTTYLWMGAWRGMVIDL